MARQFKILVVDDEPNILISLKFLLGEVGYDVRVAKDGVEALAEIQKDKPDLVLLDVMMPKLDGFSVCRTIKSTPELSGIQVIMLTARVRSVERDKGLELGACDYITKPFSTREAIERVAAALARQTS